MKKLSCLLLAGLLMGSCAYAETMTGTAKGFGGDVTVTLTVDNGVIADCAIDAADETPSIGGAALEALAAQVVEANGADIDGVAGATYTTDGVKDAVKAALGQNDAGGEKTAMVPGTYVGSANGMNDKVEVTLTVTEDAITAAEVTYQQETVGIGAPLFNKDGVQMTNIGSIPSLSIPQAIVDNQSLNVDIVAGATVTSRAILSAAAQAITLAGGNPDQWKAETATAVADHAHTADVIIVGGGGSGLTAAITAADAGVSVIVLEKNGTLGGDTVVCGAVYNSVDPVGQKALTMNANYVTTLENALNETPVNEDHAALIAQVRSDWEAFQADGAVGMFDSAAWYALQTWNGGDKVGDLKLIEKFAANCWPGAEWLYSIGMEFDEQMGQTAGSLWQRSHFSKMNMGTGFISSYLTALSGRENVQLYTNTKGVHLICDEAGKVVGVQAENAMGEIEEFTANMGVILATGGYSANAAMVQANNTSGKWDDLSALPTTNRSTCSLGMGIDMAKEIGAGTRDMEQLQLLYLGNLVDGGLSKYPARCNTATTETIFVNKEGKRFIREDGRRDEICAAVLAQTDACFYIIESADGPTYKDITDPAWRSADGFTRQYLEENGYIWVADTIEELAAKIGVPAEALLNSVNSYNTCYDAGKDETFGRTAFAARLDHAPFYATVRQASIHYTLGGLTIDLDGRVISENGDVINGLYACGEVIGGVHGGNRLGGNAVTDTVVLGRLAGAAVVADNQ